MQYDWKYSSSGDYATLANYNLAYTTMEKTYYREYGVSDRLLMSETEYYILDELNPNSDAFKNTTTGEFVLDSEGKKIFEISEFKLSRGELTYNDRFDGFDHVLHSETYEYHVGENNVRTVVSGRENFSTYENDLEIDSKVISFKIHVNQGEDGIVEKDDVRNISPDEYTRVNQSMDMKVNKYDDNDNLVLINEYNYMIGRDANGMRYDGYNSLGEINAPNAKGEIEEWEFKGGREIRNLEFNWKDQVELSIIDNYEYYNSEKKWTTGEILRKQYDMQGN
ncbi:MAG: hypothetical protein ACD_79C00272G0001, partial [uncultured bacterium]